MLPAPVVPDVVPPVVVEPVELVPEYDPLELEPIVAFVRIHSPRAELDRVLPVVPLVPVALVDDWSPRSRHPTTVIDLPFRLRSLWLLPVLVCAARAAAQAIAIAAVAPVHTRVIGASMTV